MSLSGIRLRRRLGRHGCSLVVGGLCLFFMFLLYMAMYNVPQEQARRDRKLHGENSVKHSQLTSHQEKKYRTFLVVLVITGPKYVDRRDVIRQTWLSSQDKENVIWFFAVGTNDLTPYEVQTLEDENSHYHDLLMLPKLSDSYYSLTSKLMQSLVWLDNMVDFSFMLKADDDTFAQVDIIVEELRQRTAKRLYWGFFDGRARVKKAGQWAEKKWLLCDTYLPHARGGGYILSSDLVHYVARNAEYLQQFNSEDVSMGAWLGPLDINRVHDPRFDTEYKSRGCFNDYIVTHKQTIEQMREKHANLKESGKLCRKEYRIRHSYIYNWDTFPSLCCIRNDTRVI